jgi:hypothetical protein
MSSVGLTRTLSAARLHRERPRATHVREAFLAAAALFIVLGFGIMLVKTPQSEPLTSARSVDATATIRMSPDRNEHCRELLFNNQTGSIQDAGLQFCGAPAAPPPNTAVGGTISGAHLGRIRDSFRSR